jgi:hypothetical protein
MSASSSGAEMRGSSETHRTTSELFIWALASFLCAVLNRQAVPPLVQENFGPGADYPTLSLGGVNLDDANKIALLYKTARDIGAKPSRIGFARATGVQLANDDADALEAAPPPTMNDPNAPPKPGEKPPPGKEPKDGKGDTAAA